MIATKLEAVAKHANASVISRKLAQTFTRSTERATSIRGWHDTTAGFHVSAFPKGVLVTWHLASEATSEPLDARMDRKRRMTDAMNTYLRELGYETQLIDGVGIAIMHTQQTPATGQ
jgi:hypothetical protein